jgi:hypothetical protein
MPAVPAAVLACESLQCFGLQMPSASAAVSAAVPVPVSTVAAVLPSCAGPLSAAAAALL